MGVQVYRLSIAAACELQWPKDRIIVQVLDDSTDPFIKVTYTCLSYFLVLCRAEDYSYEIFCLGEAEI
jgi:hypothetical protein